MKPMQSLWGVFILGMMTQAATLDLSGNWRFGLDPNDVGVPQAWFDRDLAQTIRLPGSLQEQGYGDKPSADTQWTSGIGMQLLTDPRFADYVNAEDFKCPFWLTPDRHYVGKAWYQRQVTVPADWQGRRVVLILERPHWETTVWVDGHKVGSQNSLGTPHQYDLTRLIKPGSMQRLTLCVDNSYVVPVGKDAHSISDQTQSNWNGITGRIQLTTEPLVYFEDIQIFPDVPQHQVRVQVTIRNHSGRSGQGTLTCQAVSPEQCSAVQSQPVTWGVEGGQIQFVHDMGADCLTWDEFHPHLYQLHLTLGPAQGQVTFGMRTVTIEDKQFAINGRKMFLRGTLECCIFPQHGYPPTDVASWKRIMGIARSYGLNHFRFHSWCPPEAAFKAADEIGFYLQVEGSCWAAFGDGTVLDQWIYHEIDRMIRAYGNHPSWLFFCPSNEPHGSKREAFLGRYLNRLKRVDPRRFYVAGSGWPQIAENQYSIVSAVRLQHWPTLKFDQPPQTFDDYRSFVEQTPVPVIGHEVGQWCAYPDLDETSQYTGVLKARNLEIFRDKLERAGMGALAHAFLMASGKFQAMLYKQEIETALRTPGLAGFQLLDLHDFPGQGTAPVGVLNALWQNKGYVTAGQYRRFCNDVVPLARMKKRIFTDDETLDVVVDVSNYGPVDLKDVRVRWDLCRASGWSLTEGILTTTTLATGGLTHIGDIHVPLNRLDRAARINLSLRLQGTDYANDWDLWVYPNHLPEITNDVAITGDVTEALGTLQQGGRVLLTLKPEQIAGDSLGTFRPIFWNRITFPKNKVHTLGILCDPDHPALAAFPTATYSTWQWQGLLDGAKPLNLGSLPVELVPVVRSIDDWNNCHRLGVLIEARLGPGRLMVTSMDLQNHLEQRPVARQLRYSLLQYMESKNFQPKVILSETQFETLVANKSVNPD